MVAMMLSSYDRGQSPDITSFEKALAGKWIYLPFKERSLLKATPPCLAN